jgi:hypothetical protein
LKSIIIIINTFKNDKIYTVFNCIYSKNNFEMKKLELNQMISFSGGSNCSRAEGIVLAAVFVGWVFGPIIYAGAIAAAGTNWTSECGASDY